MDFRPVQDTLNRAVVKNTDANSGSAEASSCQTIRFSIFRIPRRRRSPYPALAPYFLDWLAHPSYDEYWKPLAIEERFADINVPIFHIAAWYDIFQGGSLRNYIGIKSPRRPVKRRRRIEPANLLVNIGGHACKETGAAERYGKLKSG